MNEEFFMKKGLFSLMVFMSASCFSDVVIYSNSSDGPFRGQTSSIEYASEGQQCLKSVKVSDGPFRNYSSKKVLDLSECQLFIDAEEQMNKEGKCAKASKVLNSYNDGPVRGWEITLNSTKNCLCQEVKKVSGGPYKGYEVHKLVDYNLCKEALF